MIEAYEIGIKLALQDGVSEGVAAIRRDLGSLDVAIAQTTLRLSQLQRIGTQALSMTQERPERVSSGALIQKPAPVVGLPVLSEPVSSPESVPVRAETPVVTPAQSPLQRPLAGPPTMPTAIRVTAAEPGPVPVPAAVRPDAVPVAVVRSGASVDAAPRATGGPRLPEMPAAAPSANPVTQVSSPIAASTARPATQTPQAGEVRLQGNGPARESFLPKVVSSAPSMPASTATALQKVPPDSVHREKVRQANHRPIEAREVHVPQLASPLEHPVTRLASAATGHDAVASPQASMAPAVSSSFAPPAALPQAREASMRGDVFLDGARVGRWMSEQMARDAGRPNTGPTGFDPRRSPAWPGAAVTW